MELVLIPGFRMRFFDKGGKGFLGEAVKPLFYYS